MCEPRRTVAPASKLRARAWAARQSGYALCAREAMSEGELRRLYLLLQNSCGRFRRRIFVLLKSRPYQAEPYKQALWACKACAKDSCRNFIPKSIFEILLHKILKFSTRLNFKILTKPDSKLRRSRIMKFYPAKF